MWYGIWKLVRQSLQRKMFWVPQWYPYYTKTLLIHLDYWIENISEERTNVTLQANVGPNGTQKIYSKNIDSKLSSAVPIICIVILDQKLHPTQCSWFFVFRRIWKKSLFRLKLWKNPQSLQGCNNTHRHYLWYRGLNFFNFGDITKILWYCWFFFWFWRDFS